MTEQPPAQSPAEKRWRVWLALGAAPLVLALAFLPVAAWLAEGRGLRGEALTRALQSLAVFPATAGFTAAFLLTRWLARRDGLLLTDLGWRRPTLADLAVGAVGGAALGVANARWLYPVVQRLQPDFDPTLGGVSLPAVVLTLAVACVAEDSLYRGYALEALKRRHGPVVATALTSACYALLTPSGPPLMLWAALFGLVLSGVRLWRGTLWPVALIHCAVGLTPRLLAEL